MNRCLLAPESGGRARLKHAGLHLTIPAARALVRYAPLVAAKLRFWEHVVDPYLAWHSHRFVARTRFGSKIDGHTSDILPQYLYYFGVWEPDVTSWISGRLEPGDTFVDVGANVGYFTLLASTLVGGSGSVVAVEPSPALFARLHDNLERNRVRNVRPVNLAASDGPGRVIVFSGPVTDPGLTTTLPQTELAVEAEVDAQPLSEMLSTHEVRNARLVKIDVEGAEHGVVSGMDPLLAEGRADLEVLVEIHPSQLARVDKTPEDVLAVFLKAGFRPYVLENDYEPASHMRANRTARLRSLEGTLPRGSNTSVLFSRDDIDG